MFIGVLCVIYLDIFQCVLFGLCVIWLCGFSGCVDNLVCVFSGFVYYLVFLFFV